MFFVDWEDDYDVYDFFVPLIYEGFLRSQFKPRKIKIG